MQVSTHRLHPMHLLWFSITPPPGLLVRAFVGQTFMHGGSLQALQTMTMNPRSTPPMDLMLMADFAVPPSPNLLLHAIMQHWQPTQRFTSTTESLFTMKSSTLKNGIFQFILAKDSCLNLDINLKMNA